MTAHLAVLGNPIAHSRSPEIHSAFAKLTGIDLNYEKILVPEGEFDAIATNFMQGGTGLNITVPYKKTAWRFVDQRSYKVHLAQAVNTISRNASGDLVGDNTDGGGLTRDLVLNLDWSLKAKNILLLGAGGAVSGVLADLLEAKPATIDLLNRTHEKAFELAKRFSNPCLRAVKKESLSAGYDIIINGTSAGLSGQDVDLPPRVVAEHSQCYDMVYGKEITQFNRWCLNQANCTVADGLGMLVEQAALGFSIWFGTKVETATVIERLRSSL